MCYYNYRRNGVHSDTSGYSGTNNYVYVTLVGEKGESERTVLDNQGLDLCRGTVDDYIVQSSAPLGRVLLVRLEKQRYWVEDNWFCRYVLVTPTGGGDNQTFPCYCWLVGDVKVEVREGTVCAKVLERRLRLIEEEQYGFRPGRGAMDQHFTLSRIGEGAWEFANPVYMCFVDLEKAYNQVPRDILWEVLREYGVPGLLLRDIRSLYSQSEICVLILNIKSDPFSVNVGLKQCCDWFFGYQFLNGSNLRMIGRCRILPSNFPVSGDMVQAFLSPNTTLDKELKVRFG
uniref:Reverse transcriptase domain-containing protein n=1 Tax=Pygocentrus nattereri TaxID=42514 RepID=A0A3B4CQ51_PYGNA